MFSTAQGNSLRRQSLEGWNAYSVLMVTMEERNKSKILLWEINFIFMQTFLLFCTSNMVIIKTLLPVACHYGRELLYVGAKGVALVVVVVVEGGS